MTLSANRNWAGIFAVLMYNLYGKFPYTCKWIFFLGVFMAIFMVVYLGGK